MKSIEIIPYNPTHEMGIKALCRIPVSGNISLSLEREPSYYEGACIQTEVPEVFVCVRLIDGLVCGVFNIGFRRLFYEGKIVNVRYLCDLRIHPAFQKSSLFYRMIKFVNNHELASHGLPAQTVVFSDNMNMIQMINNRAKKHLGGPIPFYHHAGTLITNMLTLKRRIKAGENMVVRTAKIEDLSAMQTFWEAEGSKIDYFPFYDFEELDKPYFKGLAVNDFYLAFLDNQLVGITGIWNQKSIKQTRIVRYSPTYRLIKPFYNLYASIVGKPRLPKAGAIVNYLGLHSILIKNRNLEVFASLLSYITETVRDSGVEYLLFALDKNDPLQKMVETLPNKRQLSGNFYLVNNGEKLPDDLLNAWFYLEATRI